MSYSEPQMDALRDVATLGSDTAGTALGAMLGRTVDLEPPTVHAVAFADAAEAVGPVDTLVTAVVIPIFGEMDAVVVLLFTPEAADTLCSLLGVQPGSEMGVSALQEIGNVLGTSYVGSIEALTGLRLEPRFPQAHVDSLSAVLAAVFGQAAGAADTALLMCSSLRVEGEACSLSFLLLPSRAGVADLLQRLGLG